MKKTNQRRKWILTKYLSRIRKSIRKKLIVTPSGNPPFFFYDINAIALKRPEFMQAFINRKYKAVLLKKGLKEFTFRGKPIIAINKSNAERKAQNAGLI